MIYLEQELDLWENLEEEKRRYKSKLKALEYNYKVNSATHKHYKSHIVRLEKEIKEVQNKFQVGDEELKASVKLLTTIKGIGVKTALLLLTSTNGFKNFQSSKSLTKYFGVGSKIIPIGQKKLTLGKCRTVKTLSVANCMCAHGAQCVQIRLVWICIQECWQMEKLKNLVL